MGVNYFRSAVRDSPINVAAGRVILGCYLIWKVLSYEWQSMVEWPVRLRELWMFLHPPLLQSWIGVEKWLLIALLSAFVLGYRTGLTSVLSAVLVSHLATLMWSLTASGQTTSLFIGVYFLLFYGLFRQQDSLSVDGLRRTRNWSLRSLNRHLKFGGRKSYRVDALKWGLVSLGVVYFGSGLDKLVRTPFSTWMETENLARILVYRRELYHTAKPVADFLLAHPILIKLSEAGTIVLELGFLVAILAGLPIATFLVMFAVMHAVIALAVGPFFFDLYVFYLLFVPWDRLFARLSSETSIDLIYDERCFFCTRSLYPFKLIDVNETITFYSQSNLPNRYTGESDADFGSEMVVIKNDETYGGYHAFRELFRQFSGVRWLGRVMAVPEIERIGVVVYRYIATHRKHHFTCRLDGGALNATWREENVSSETD